MELKKIDEKVLLTFLKVGVLTKEHLNKLGVTDKRIKLYINERIIERKYTIVTESYYYVLTRKGNSLAKKMFPDKSKYILKMRLDYAIKLTNVYFSLNDEEKETWIVGKDIYEFLYLKIGSYKDNPRNDYTHEELISDLKDNVYVIPHAIYKDNRGNYRAVFINSVSHSDATLCNLGYTCNVMEINIDIL